MINPIPQQQRSGSTANAWRKLPRDAGPRISAHRSSERQARSSQELKRPRAAHNHVSSKAGNASHRLPPSSHPLRQYERLGSVESVRPTKQVYTCRGSERISVRVPVVDEIQGRWFRRAWVPATIPRCWRGAEQPVYVGIETRRSQHDPDISRRQRFKGDSLQPHRRLETALP